MGRLALVLVRGATRTRVDWLPPTTDPSDENGQVILEVQRYFLRDVVSKLAVYILHEERRIGAIHEIARGASSEQLTAVLQPVCRVHGTVQSDGLVAMGMPLRQTWVNVRSSNDYPQLLEYYSTDPKHAFDLLLPPGRYTLSLSGSGSREEASPFIRATTEFKYVPITVPAGQPDLDLGAIDLRPTKWATLIGRPAPQIDLMKAWKNGPPATLVDLRGQVVWLRFGAGAALLAGDLPELVKLHDAFGDKGLTIIMISSNASLEELEEDRSRNYRTMDGVREVPFRIAIDGDAPADREGTSQRRTGATFERYGIVGYPTDILIDPAGNLLGQPEVFRAKEAISQMLTAREKWHQPFAEVYRLAEGEVLKRIAPPFIPERLEYYREMHGGRTMPRGSDQRFALILFWDGRLRLWGEGPAFSRSLSYVLRSVLRLWSYEYEGPQPLLDLLVPPGDWIVRDQAPPEDKLRALEELVARELGRRIRFEKRSVEQEVIIATGRFQLHPLAGMDKDKSVHVYTQDAATEQRIGAGTARSVSDFLQTVGDDIHMPVLDRTEPGEPVRVPYSLHRSSRLQDISDQQERTKQLQVLLDHLTAQTDLRFEVRKEEVPVWFLTEPTGP